MDIFQDHKLSSVARFIYLQDVHVGRVLTVDELDVFMPEGRTRLSTAQKELKQFGYIKELTTRMRNGQVVTKLLFGDDSLNVTVENIELTITEPGVGNPIVGNPSVLHSGTAILANSLAIANSEQVLEVLRTSNTVSRPLSGVGKPDEETNEIKTKEVGVGWPFEDAKPQPKRGEIDDEATGAIGQVLDKKKLRQLKYTKFEEQPQSQLRENKPEELWTADDLVAEFYDLLREKVPGISGQVNGKQLIQYIRKEIRDTNATVESMLKAIRMFFKDPRNLREAGVGKTIMGRFFSFYPTVAVKVSKEEVDYSLPESMLRKQRKFLGEQE